MSDGDERWRSIPVPLPQPGVLRPFEVDGTRLLLCNVEGTPHVLADLCPHAGVALAPGRLVGCVLECPFHGGKLDVRDGKPVAPPIRRPVRTFAVRAMGEGFEVALGSPR